MLAIAGDLLLAWYEVTCLLMAKLNIVSQHVYVEELPNILLPVVGCTK